MRRWLRSALAVLLLLGAVWYVWGEPGSETLSPSSGTARAADGDSFFMRVGASEISIRIAGIDAPEYRQSCMRADGSPWPCGAEAYAALSALVMEPGLVCIVEAEDQFDRPVGQCRTDQTDDIGAVMVARGLAVPNGRGEFPRYWQEQEAAEQARTGLWQGRFDRPADWRRANPR